MPLAHRLPEFNEIGMSRGPPIQRNEAASRSLPADVWECQRILALDGAGAKGLSCLYIIQELFNHVAMLEKGTQPAAQSSTSSPLFFSVKDYAVQSPESLSDPTLPYRPCHYFDYIFGSQMGGIVAILLGVLRLTVEEAIQRAERIYGQLRQVTRHPSPIIPPFNLGSSKSNNSDWLRHTLWQYLEAVGDSEMKRGKREHSRPPKQARRQTSSQLSSMSVDERFCQTVVLTTHKAGKGVSRPFLLGSYRRSDGVEAFQSSSLKYDTSMISIVDAARATMSNRRLYESVHLPGLRGSLRATTPSCDNAAALALDEVARRHGDGVDFLLSIGDDEDYPCRTNSDLSDDPQGRIVDGHQPAPTVDSSNFDLTYHDFVVPGISDDLSSSEIRAKALEYCDTHGADISRWAGVLVESRRHRARTVEWQSYAGFAMRCPLCTVAGNEESRRPYDVAGLQQHYLKRHAHATDRGPTG